MGILAMEMVLLLINGKVVIGRMVFGYPLTGIIFLIFKEKFILDHLQKYSYKYFIGKSC